jgi:hypothetical protein
LFQTSKKQTKKMPEENVGQEQLKKCPHCKRDVPMSASKCEHCGSTLSHTIGHYMFVAAVIIAVVMTATIAIALSPSSPTTPKSTTQSTVNNNLNICSNIPSLKKNAETIDFKKLDKDPESFTGKLAKFTGQILQIQESGGAGMIRLAVTKTDYGYSFSDVVYVEYQSHTDAVVDDIVTVYGKMTGSTTYTSQANFKITLPSMIACDISKGIESKTEEIKPVSTGTSTKTKTTTTTTEKNTVQTPAPAPVSSTPKVWHVAYTITNSVDTQTSPFAMQGDQWKITYACLGSPSGILFGDYNGNNFYGYIKSTSGSIYQIEDFAFNITCPINEPIKNTSYFYSEAPGQYYLDLSSAYGATYTVTVEDYY